MGFGLGADPLTNASFDHDEVSSDRPTDAPDVIETDLHEMWLKSNVNLAEEETELRSALQHYNRSKTSKENQILKRKLNKKNKRTRLLKAKDIYEKPFKIPPVQYVSRLPSREGSKYTSFIASTNNAEPYIRQK